MSGDEVDRVVLTPEQALEVAVDLHRQGRVLEAAEIYRRLLTLRPDDPRLLHFYAVAAHQLGHSADAILLLGQVVAACPEWADAHNNLGNVLKESQHLEEAATSYERAIALRPDEADFHSNLGVVLKRLDRLEEAERSLRHALALRGDHGAAFHNLGAVLFRMNRIDEAAAAFREAVRLSPGRAAPWRHLAASLARAGRMDDVRAVFDQWLAFEPDNPSALHMVAALFGESVPERASDGFVRALFDPYSGDFDAHIAKLEYRAPDLIAAVLDRVLGPEGHELDILDAGVGTGLCGPHLRPRARRLVGVDLSGGMIARAQARGLYDRLDVAEITEWLAATDETFDVAVSADTLCYFGVLRGVLGGCARVLRPGGLLVFTVEHRDEGGDPGWRLQPNGRYAHSAAYVCDALAGAGFDVRVSEPMVLRLEGGQPVAGLVLVASRSGGQAAI
jgi:predicted TPR repeat methyltransferase